jgi:nucleoside-diphosphate-sugar epimerase
VFERGIPGQAYNIVDDEPAKWGAFLDHLADTFGVKRPARVPRALLHTMPYARAVMLGNYRVSNRKARRDLGFVPQARTYREGIMLASRAIGGSSSHPTAPLR